jgi:hypothetical protein
VKPVGLSSLVCAIAVATVKQLVVQVTVVCCRQPMQVLELLCVA